MCDGAMIWVVLQPRSIFSLLQRWQSKGQIMTYCGVWDTPRGINYGPHGLEFESLHDFYIGVSSRAQQVQAVVKFLTVRGVVGSQFFWRWCRRSRWGDYPSAVGMISPLRENGGHFPFLGRSPSVGFAPFTQILNFWKSPLLVADYSGHALRQQQGTGRKGEWRFDPQLRPDCPTGSRLMFSIKWVPRCYLGALRTGWIFDFYSSCFPLVLPFSQVRLVICTRLPGRMFLNCLNRLKLYGRYLSFDTPNARWHTHVFISATRHHWL